MLPHEEWLFKADHDLKSSLILFKVENPLFDIAIYHAQQCGEKSLKAFLAFKRQEVSKTHNVKALLDKCIDIDNSFNYILEECIYLNPFATLYRYPEGELLPQKKEVEKAIHSAEIIYQYILEKVK